MSGAIVIWVVYGVFLALLLYLTVRNARVGPWREGLLNRLSSAAKDDIVLHRDWMWRYSKFLEVSYYQIVFSFRRLKPENYWDDCSFLDI